MKQDPLLTRISFISSTVSCLLLLFPTWLEATTKQSSVKPVAGTINLVSQNAAANQKESNADENPKGQSIPSTETADGHIKTGDKLASEKKWNDAENDYRKAIRLDPGNAEWHGRLGFALLNQAKWQEAEGVLRRALELNPLEASYHTNLGYSLQQQMKVGEAEKEFKEAIKIKPGDGVLHGNLAVLLHSQQRLMEAEGVYRKALALIPDKKVWRDALAAVIKEQGGEGENPAPSTNQPGVINEQSPQAGDKPDPPAAGSTPQPFTRPIPLNRPRPDYSREAQGKGVQGVIRIRALVGDDGRVKTVKIVKGLPYGLNPEAAKAVYKMKFKPATKDGQPVAYWVPLDVEFHLRRR